MLIIVKNTLHELATELQNIGTTMYAQPSKALHQTTVGQHTRHIIEYFQMLLLGYDKGTFSYEHRVRNKDIETNLDVAIQLLQNIVCQIDKADKQLVINNVIFESTFSTNTSYYRELAYNLDHCIHHQALIRIAVEELTNYQLPTHFGVAPSTLAYREQCAH